MAIALAAAFVAAGGAAVWHTSRLAAQASSAASQRLRERLQKGVGGEVRFANSSSRPEQVDEAVASAADFILRRSGLRMSDETRKRLAKAESDVLKGKTKHITLGELTDSLTGGVVERLGTLTDEEIQLAADVSADEQGEIRSRADGRWGILTKEALVQQARSGREWSRRGDPALRDSLRPMIEQEVQGRAATLGAALPEQFGQAGSRGLTPTQALIVAYSVAADDPLTDSRDEVEQMIVQKRMAARQTREQKKALGSTSGQPYGARGSVHPSAAPLFFGAGVEKILSRGEGGAK